MIYEPFSKKEKIVYFAICTIFSYITIMFFPG